MNTEQSNSRVSVGNPNVFSRVTQLVSLGANLAVIAGIAFAYAQIQQAKNVERCRVAMIAVEPTLSTQFLESYRKLRRAYLDDPTLSSPEPLRDDLYYVLTVYDNIALLCLRGIADEDLVRASTYSAIKELLPIIDAMKLPVESRTNVESLLKRF